MSTANADPDSSAPPARMANRLKYFTSLPPEMNGTRNLGATVREPDCGFVTACAVRRRAGGGNRHTTGLLYGIRSGGMSDRRVLIDRAPGSAFRSGGFPASFAQPS